MNHQNSEALSMSADPAGSDPWCLPFRWAALVVLIFLIAYGFRCVRKGWYDPPRPGQEGVEKRKHKDRGTDFTAYYSAGELARKGENIYDYKSSSTPFRPFLYPPMFAVFPMSLLSLFEHNTALSLFYVLNVGLLLATLWLLRRLFWPEDVSGFSFWRRPEVGLALAVLTCGRFFDSNMVLGQVNVIILFLVTLGLFFIVRDKGIPGGLAVALATAFKVTPGLFGLYFLWSGRRWAMLGGAAGLILFLLIAPATLLGVSQNWTLLKVFMRHATNKVGLPAEEPGNRQGPRDPLEDQPQVGWEKKEWKQENKVRGVGISLEGTFTKLLSPVVALDEMEGGRDQMVNILNLEPQQAKRIAKGVGLVLLLLMIALTVPRWSKEGVFPVGLSWSLVALTMLLISPLTRKAHGVVLVIPSAILIALLQQKRLAGFPQKLAWVGLLVLGGTGLVTSPDVLDHIEEGLSELAHARGAFTWAMLLLFPVLANMLWQFRPRGK